MTRENNKVERITDFFFNQNAVFCTVSGKDSSLGYLDDAFWIYQKFQGKSWSENSTNLTRSCNFLNDTSEKEPFA